MQIFINDYPEIHPGYPIDKLAAIDKILFMDIETTGLSREKTDLYLIGCGWFDPDGYHTIQWFGDSALDEAELISMFSEYIRDRFSLLIHYNGNHFDIPYLKFKADSHGLPDPFEGLESYDIYAVIKPYKNILNLPSLRQREIEQLLNINSDDPYTGKELISVYHRYVKHPCKELLKPLVFHNCEDLKGMAYILPVLHYTGLEKLRLEYVSHEIHEFENFCGEKCRELLISCRHDLFIPRSFKTRHGHALISVRSDNTALIRLPVFDGTLKLFYENYRDYFFLPFEDCCVHRSVASGVDSSRREPAAKETCYTRHTGMFFPQVSPLNSQASTHPPLFRSSFDSKEYYLAYDDTSAADIFRQQIEGIVLC